MHILGEMRKALPAQRDDLSAHAPRIVTININPEKIGELIGPKGKTIRGIQEETGAELTVDDSGLVTIAAVGGESMERARQMVQALTAEPVIGETYEGTVKSTTTTTAAAMHTFRVRWGRKLTRCPSLLTWPSLPRTPQPAPTATAPHRHRPIWMAIE